MKSQMYVLYEPGGRQARGYSYGKLVEVRYVDVVRTDIESITRDEMIDKLKPLDREYLRECRVGYVDDMGVGEYCDALDFLDGNVIDRPPSNMIIPQSRKAVNPSNDNG